MDISCAASGRAAARALSRLDAFIGDEFGYTHFLENTGTASAPAFADPVVEPFGIRNIGYDAVPAFGDIDGDGDLDAFIGDEFERDAIFFENTGTANAPAFRGPWPDAFGLADADAGYHTAPALVDIDGDGDLDLLFGNDDGRIFFFENTGPEEALTFEDPLSNPFGLTDVGFVSTPALADFDGDGDLDALIGESNGS